MLTWPATWIELCEEKANKVNGPRFEIEVLYENEAVQSFRDHTARLSDHLMRQGKSPADACPITQGGGPRGRSLCEIDGDLFIPLMRPTPGTPGTPTTVAKGTTGPGEAGLVESWLAEVAADPWWAALLTSIGVTAVILITSPM